MHVFYIYICLLFAIAYCLYISSVGVSLVIVTILVSFAFMFLTGTPLNGAMVLAVPLLGLGL